MSGFTPLSSLLGGALIGLAASLLLLFLGRIAGVSGIFAGILATNPSERPWRTAFILGLIAGGGILFLLSPHLLLPALNRSLTATALAGLLVGFGVRMGNGCTSGHGVCGLSRLSRRSLAATLAFMGSGFLTAALIRFLTGGVL